MSRMRDALKQLETRCGVPVAAQPQTEAAKSPATGSTSQVVELPWQAAEAKSQKVETPSNVEATPRAVEAPRIAVAIELPAAPLAIAVPGSGYGFDDPLDAYVPRVEPSICVTQAEPEAPAVKSQAASLPASTSDATPSDLDRNLCDLETRVLSTLENLGRWTMEATELVARAEPVVHESTIATSAPFVWPAFEPQASEIDVAPHSAHASKSTVISDTPSPATDRGPTLCEVRFDPQTLGPYENFALRIADRASASGSLILGFISVDAAAASGFSVFQLAVELGRHGRTLVVDGQLDRPVLAAQPWLDTPTGWGQVLTGHCDWASVIRPTHAPGVSLVTRGQIGTSDSPRFIVPQWKPLRRDFRFVLCHFSARAAAEAAAVATLCDATYIILGLGSTSRLQARDTSEGLRASGANVEGCLVAHADDDN